MKWKLVERGLLIGAGIATVIGLSASLLSEKTGPVVEPLGKVGSALHLPEPTTVCVEVGHHAIVNGWPVYEAMAEWNKNGVVKLTVEDGIDNCTSVVVVTVGDVPDQLGSTELFSRNIFNVQLGYSTPVDQRLSVICHELGHVLGLSHSQGDGSCMDPSQNNSSPTKADLATVSRETYKPRNPK